MSTPPPPPPHGGYGAPTPYTPGQTRPGELLDRFLARLIDGVLLGVVYAILFVVLGAILIVDAGFDDDGTYDDGSSLLFWVVMGVVLAGLSLGYYAFLESSRGATIGKQLMKLKVVGPDGVSNPTMEQAIRRNIFTAAPIGYVVPIVGPLIAGAAALVGQVLIAVGINNDTVGRRAWHDHFAGETQVLKVG